MIGRLDFTDKTMQRHVYRLGLTDCHYWPETNAKLYWGSHKYFAYDLKKVSDNLRNSKPRNVKIIHLQHQYVSVQ